MGNGVTELFDITCVVRTSISNAYSVDITHQPLTEEARYEDKE